MVAADGRREGQPSQGGADRGAAEISRGVDQRGRRGECYQLTRRPATGTDNTILIIETDVQEVLSSFI